MCPSGRLSCEGPFSFLPSLLLACSNHLVIVPFGGVSVTVLGHEAAWKIEGAWVWDRKMEGPWVPDDVHVPFQPWNPSFCPYIIWERNVLSCFSQASFFFPCSCMSLNPILIHPLNRIILEPPWKGKYSQAAADSDWKARWDQVKGARKLLSASGFAGSLQELCFGSSGSEYLKRKWASTFLPELAAFVI